MATKPLLWDTNPMEVTERELESNEMLRASNDPNWIPGYSEQRHAAALKNAEYGSMSYQQRDLQLKMLGVDNMDDPPIHITSVRVSNLAGEVNDNVMLDMAHYKKDGYKQMTVEDLERYGMRMPPLYHIAADGSIRRGDVALMFVDAQRAKLTRDRKDAETKDLEDNANTIGALSGVAISVEQSRDPNFSF